MYCDFPDFARCCFCLPLRLGVLVFGYLNILYSALMIGLYSYSLHIDARVDLLYHGTIAEVAEEVGIALYILDLLINAGLVYGAHRQHLMFIKVFYCYSIATTIATVIIVIITIWNLRNNFYSFEVITFAICGICFQGYLIGLVRSLIKKLAIPPQMYENPLQQIIAGEIKNEIYDSSTVVAA